MEAIKNIFIDSLNGFALNQIPLFLFQLLCAALGAWVVQFIINKKWGEPLLKYAPLTATMVALVASIVKYSLPAAVLGAAMILLLVKRKPKFRFETIGLAFIVLIGIGCGVGSVVQTVLGTAILSVILLFTPLIKDNE